MGLKTLHLPFPLPGTPFPGPGCNSSFSGSAISVKATFPERPSGRLAAPNIAALKTLLSNYFSAQSSSAVSLSFCFYLCVLFFVYGLFTKMQAP